MKATDLTTIQGKNIIIDISKLLSDEVVYINATKLAKQFNKRVDNFLRLEETKEYLRVLNTSDVRELEIIKTLKGKYGGTYFHSDVVVYFLRWLNIEFAVKCDMYIKKMIQETHNDRIKANATAEANKSNSEWIEARSKATVTRNNLTDTIKTFCEYAELNRDKPYKDNRCPYYIKLTNLVYQALDIKKPKGAKNVRDVYSGAVVGMVEYLEDMLINLLKSHIQQGTEYHEAVKSIKELIMFEATLFEEVE